MLKFYSPRISIQNFFRDSEPNGSNFIYDHVETDERLSQKDAMKVIFRNRPSNFDLEEVQPNSKFEKDFSLKERIGPPKVLNENEYEFSEIIPSEIRRRFNVVLEAKSGKTSVAEICRRESISQDDFLKWSKEFLNIRKGAIRSVPSRLAYENFERSVVNVAGRAQFNYFENYIDFFANKILVVDSRSRNKLDESGCWDDLICLEKLNDIRYINKHLELVNSKLTHGGLHVGCFETFNSRREKMKINKFPVLRTFYFGLEFLFKRILPKVSFTKRLYFNVTEGRNRLLSKAEGLGRLVSCGFKIIDFKTIDGTLFYVVKKDKEPEFNMNVSYGPIFKMPRLGKNGKTILVYKLRTMHPYSEYLQDYIVRAHGYSESGKPANDFRIPKWGKIMRKFWLDELPQLINVLKGEMKLVGIRPVSQRYFQDIPREMQKLRSTQKPGCIPPYVSLNRDSNVMSVLRAEKDYLVEKVRNPYFTDIKYFFSALVNIAFRNKRSA